MARCPDSEGGSHHTKNKGWSNAHDGVLHVCSCGSWALFPTAEMIYAAETRRVDGKSNS